MLAMQTAIANANWLLSLSLCVCVDCVCRGEFMPIVQAYFQLSTSDERTKQPNKQQELERDQPKITNYFTTHILKILDLTFRDVKQVNIIDCNISWGVKRAFQYPLPRISCFLWWKLAQQEQTERERHGPLLTLVHWQIKKKKKKKKKQKEHDMPTAGIQPW